MITQRVFVTGKVQNVGFRDWALRHAREFGIAGWVRNTRDGRIEMLVVGEEDAALAFIAAAHQGPPLARVDQVEATPDAERAPKGFTKRFTA